MRNIFGQGRRTKLYLKHTKKIHNFFYWWYKTPPSSTKQNGYFCSDKTSWLVCCKKKKKPEELFERKLNAVNKTSIKGEREEIIVAPVSWFLQKNRPEDLKFSSVSCFSLKCQRKDIKKKWKNTDSFVASLSVGIQPRLTTRLFMLVCGVETRPYWQYGLCKYIKVHTKIATQPVILWIELGGKSKWLPLNFGYNDAMRSERKCCSDRDLSTLSLNQLNSSF